MLGCIRDSMRASGLIPDFISPTVCHVCCASLAAHVAHTVLMSALQCWRYMEGRRPLVRTSNAHPTKNTEGFLYQLLLTRIPFTSEKQLSQKEESQDPKATYMVDCLRLGILNNEYTLEAAMEEYATFNMWQKYNLQEMMQGIMDPKRTQELAKLVEGGLPDDVLGDGLTMEQVRSGAELLLQLNSMDMDDHVIAAGLPVLEQILEDSDLDDDGALLHCPATQATAPPTPDLPTPLAEVPAAAATAGEVSAQAAASSSSSQLQQQPAPAAPAAQATPAGSATEVPAAAAPDTSAGSATEVAAPTAPPGSDTEVLAKAAAATEEPASAHSATEVAAPAAPATEVPGEPPLQPVPMQQIPLLQQARPGDAVTPPPSSLGPMDANPVSVHVDRLDEGQRRAHDAVLQALEASSSTQAGFQTPLVLVVGGPPGCGKTTTTRCVYESAAAAGWRVIPAAMTHAAKQRMDLPGANTLHSAIGVWGTRYEALPTHHPVHQRLCQTNLLIVDEASMMDANLLSITMQRLKDATLPPHHADPSAVHTSDRPAEPWRGRRKVLLLVGDMEQLPPVCHCYAHTVMGVCDKHHLLFNEAFTRAQHYMLQTNHRAASDPTLSEFLSDVRSALPTQATVTQVLGQCRIDADQYEGQLTSDAVSLVTTWEVSARHCALFADIHLL